MPFCRDCGHEVGEGDKFCKNCGGLQQTEAAEGQPQAAPPPPPPAAAVPAAPPPPPPAAAAPVVQPTPSRNNALYALIGVVVVLVVAGAVVGIIFGVKGCSEQKAVENADKYVSDALSYVNEVDDMEEDLIETTKALDITVGTEQLQKEANKIHDQLSSAMAKLDAASSTLQKIDKPKLPDWWDDYISLIEAANAEKIKAYEDWDDFITRLTEIDQFNQTYQAMVAAYVAAINTLNTAADQHDSESLNDVPGGYAAAKATSGTAVGQLEEARRQLELAKSMEPSADLSQFEAAINMVSAWIPDFQRTCDLGMAGQDAEHNALVDQIRPTFNSFPRDISFDIVSWFQATRDKYIQSVEEHLAKEEEYRRRAAEIWNANNP